MSDNEKFELFGAIIAIAGFYLTVTAKAGEGHSVIKLFGLEITLAAAGGILVMALGAVTFALPTLLQGKAPGNDSVDQLRIAYTYARRDPNVAAGSCGTLIDEAVVARGHSVLPSAYEQQVTYQNRDAKVWIMCQSDSVFVGAASYSQASADSAQKDALAATRSAIPLPEVP